ncbi:hypothetical protein FRC17_000487 [Serendipita sp. 399]|nr:hypothetical protein FRC17_000487 [Serendipita sp. 399]
MATRSTQSRRVPRNSSSRYHLPFVFVQQWWINIRIGLQALCGDLIAFALEQDKTLGRFIEWKKITRDIRNAVYEWSELNAIGSFLKCDMISGKVASLRSTIAALSGIADDAASSPGFGISAASTLVPTLLTIYRDQRAVDTFAALPSAHRDTAISLLRRVLTSTRDDPAVSDGSTSSKEPPTLRDLVAATILHLERKDIDAALSEVPDLTEEIDLKGGKAFGSSSLGVTLLGQRKSYGPVILKTLQHVDLTDAKSYRSLQRELKTRLSLSHPYLLPFLGLASTPQGLALVSPHTAKGTAPHYLASHEYPSANAISLLFNVAKGLQYLHECWPAITHGDVRGANIWINGRGEPLLGDWGLYEIHEAINLNEAIRWAAPELVCSEAELRKISSKEKPPPEWGTAHLEPARAVNGIVEDALIEVYTPMSDVWSFGMTIYELMMCRLPFHQYTTDTAIPVALKQGERPIPPTSTKDVRIEWQPELWVLMQDCWRSDRRTRPTMESVSRRLDSILERSKGTLGCLDRFRSGSVSVRSAKHLSPVLHKTSMPNLKSLSPISTIGLSRATSPSETEGLRLRSQSPSGSHSSLGHHATRSPTNSVSSAKARAMSPLLTMNGKPVVNTSGSAASITSPSSRTGSSLSRLTPQSPVLSPSTSTGSLSKGKMVPGLRRRVSAIFSGLGGAPKERYITPVLTRSSSFLEKVATPPPLERQEPEIPQERNETPEKAVLGSALEAMTLTERRAYEQKHGLQRGFLQMGSPSGSERSTPQMRSPVSPRETCSPTPSLQSQTLRASSSLTHIRSSASDMRNIISSPIASVPADFPISHRHTRTSQDSNSAVNLPTRQRASGPYSVGSENLSSSAISPSSEISYQSDHTFNIIVEDVDETAHDEEDTNGKGNNVVEGDEFPSNTSGEESVHSHSASDLIHEAFQGISIEPSENNHASHLPEDVGSPQGEAKHLPARTVQSKSPLERDLSQEVGIQCQRAVDSFLKAEATFLQAPVAKELDLLAYGSSEALTLAISTLQPVLQDLIAARQRLVERISGQLPIATLSNLRGFFDVCEAAISSLQIIYQEYVKSMETLETAIGDSQLARYSSLETAGLKSSSQRVLHSGTLHYPVDPDGQRKSIEDRGTSVKVFVILTNSCLIIAESRSRMGIKRYPVRAVISLHNLLIPDVELARVSQQQIFFLNSSDGRRIASPLQLRYRDALSPRREEPRLRATSAVSMLGVREDDGQRLLFPKELVLLAASSGERTMWRERLIKAKLGVESVPAKKPVTRSMFRMDKIVRLPFIPSSSALYPTRGSRSVLICADGSTGGAYLKEDVKPLMNIMGPGPVKQCCVVEVLHIALFLIGKTLFLSRLEDIGEQESAPPVVVKTNVSLFHIGYHRGLLLLVVASEGSKSTILKIYNGVCRGRSGMVSPSMFGKTGKSFKSLCEQEIAGSIHALDILEDGIVAIGTTGFQLVTLDGSIARVQYLPMIKAGASSEAAQRSKTSKAVGVCRSGGDILLCYADFGLYVNSAGEILGRSIDWTIPKVSSVAFAPPYFFLFSENYIEVRQIGSGKKLETIDGTGFRLVRGVDGARSLLRSVPALVEDGEISGDVALEAVEQESALLHLVVRSQDSDGEFDLMELQMEVLDLTA